MLITNTLCLSVPIHWPLPFLSPVRLHFPCSSPLLCGSPTLYSLPWSLHGPRAHSAPVMTNINPAALWLQYMPCCAPSTYSLHAVGLFTRCVPLPPFAMRECGCMYMDVSAFLVCPFSPRLHLRASSSRAVLYHIGCVLLTQGAHDAGAGR